MRATAPGEIYVHPQYMYTIPAISHNSHRYLCVAQFSEFLQVGVSRYDSRGAFVFSSGAPTSV